MRWLWLAAKCLLGAELLYLTAANIALRLGAVQAAFVSTDSIKLDFASAWSWWPGSVHARRAVVRMQDRNVQFVMRVANADVTLSLPDLLRHTLHATRVRADGVSVRFRHRIAPQSANAPFVAALPALEGFDDPPLIEAGPPTPPLTEAEYNLWTVHLDDVDAKVTELWVHTIRFEGSARASGSFRLRPAKRLWVNPAALELEAGTLTTGPHTIMSDVHGEVTCTVDPFDVEPIVGMGMFPFISAKVALSGRVPDGAAIAFWAGSFAPWSVGGEAGTFDVRATMNHGVLVGQNEAHYRNARLRVEHQPSGWASEASVDLAVTGPLTAAPARLQLALKGSAIPRAGAAPVALELRALSAWVASSTADFTQSWRVVGAGVDLAELRIDDVAALDPLVTSASAGLHLRGGAARVSVKAERDANASWSGSLSLDAKRGKAQLDGAHVESDARVTGTFHGNARGEAQAALELEVPRFTSRAGDAHVDGGATLSAHYAANRAGAQSFTGELRVAQIRAYQGAAEQNPASSSCPWAELASARLSGRLELTAGAAAEANGSVKGKIGAMRLDLGNFSATARETEIATDLRARGVDGASVTAHVAARDLVLKNAGGAPRSWQADVHALDVDGELAQTTEIVRGPLRVQMSGIAGQVGTTKLAGNLSAALKVAARRGATTFGVSGDVSARKVIVSSGSREVRDWWANLRVSQAEVQLASGVNLRAAVQGSLQNALPALNLLTSKDAIPGWMPTALPLEKLSVTLDIQRHCRLTDVQVRDAKGGPLTAKGRFQLEPGETRGAVLVTLPAIIPVSVGFDFVEDQSNTSPVVGDAWLERHTGTMDKALAERRASTCAPEPPTCRPSATAEGASSPDAKR